MKNNTPSSEFEDKDRCPSCGSYCNIHIDLDDNDNCNDCRNQIYGGLEMGQIIPKEEPKQQCKDCNDNLSDCTCIEDTIDMKQETLEEAAENYSKITLNRGGLMSDKQVNGFIAGAKYQQKRSYSEEEALELATLEQWREIQLNKIGICGRVDLHLPYIFL